MRIGTTPTHTFELPSTIGGVDKIKVTYAQGRDVVLEKEFDGSAVINNSISFKLSQEETFLFNPKLDVFIQVRVLVVGGTALASDIITTTAEKCLDSEVL